MSKQQELNIHNPYSFKCLTYVLNAEEYQRKLLLNNLFGWIHHLAAEKEKYLTLLKNKTENFYKQEAEFKILNVC